MSKIISPKFRVINRNNIQEKEMRCVATLWHADMKNQKWQQMKGWQMDGRDFGGRIDTTTLLCLRGRNQTEREMNFNQKGK